MEQGELFKVLQKFGRFESTQACFYVAQIVIFFEYLHYKGLIYRDLKPENVLLQSNGYLKVTDFGFCKYLKPGERTQTLCGTPEYLAPEILLHKGHGKAVDWYCLGIFIYELMVGVCPYSDEDPMTLFKKILREPIRFPRGFNSDAKSLIKHLTAHDLSKRYGNLKRGVKDIKNHRFFKYTEWGDIAAMKLKAPYVPPRKERNLGKKGMRVYQIPEHSDKMSPSVQEARDPFLGWF